MYTQGARNGEEIEIYHVTNLNDSGVGSFRDAVAKGNRIIVFDVSGTIMLTSELKIYNVSNLTILGQTAPGGGICLGGESVRFRYGSDIILRYLRFRMGDTDIKEEDSLGVRDCTNFIMDHCSVSWSIDECLSAYANRNFTAQYSIISESLNNSVHAKGKHGYGGIWGGQNASFHHNLIASHNGRMPRIGTSKTTATYNEEPDTESLIDIRNNVFYNWGNGTGYGGENKTRVNFVNNYYKPGSNSSVARIFQHEDNTVSGAALHVSGNIMEGVADITNDNWLGVVVKKGIDDVKWIKCEEISDGFTENGITKTNDEFIKDYPVTTCTAQEAYADVLENAGASKWRDTTDMRVIKSVIDRTASNGSNGSIGLIDSQNDVGGWSWIYEGSPVVDSDNDGISDEWEDTHSLDKYNASDAILLAASGYTNVEEYANSLIKPADKLDRFALGMSIDRANSIDKTLYAADRLAEMDKAFKVAKDIYGSAETQQELDEAAEALDITIDNLTLNSKTRLQNYIDKVKSALSENVYLPQCMVRFQNAINKAKNDIDINADDETLDADYEELKDAYDNLIVSNKGSLTSKMSEARTFVNSGEYGKNALKKLTDAINSANDTLRKSTYTNEEIQTHIDELQTCIDELLAGGQSLIDEYIGMLDSGIFDVTNLSEKSVAVIEQLKKEGNRLKSNNADADMVAEFGAQMFSALGELIYENDTKEYIKIQDFEDEALVGSPLELIKENGNTYLKPATIENLYTEVSDVKDTDYFSVDFTFKENIGSCIPMSFVFDDGSKIQIKVGNVPGNYGIKIFYINPNSVTFDISNAYAVSIKENKWNNIICCFDSDTGIFKVYLNNVEIYSGVPNGYNSEHSCIKKFGLVDGYISQSIAMPILVNESSYIDNIAMFRIASKNGFVYGDADGDELLTAEDVAVILQKTLNLSYIMPLENKTADYIKYIDVTVDGVLTADDATNVLQKVLNADYIMEVEKGVEAVKRLTIQETGWAYPNVAYWTLADYPEGVEQKYLVTLYKDGAVVKDYEVDITKDELEIQPKIVRAHIDLTEDMKQNVGGEYSFSVKALGDGSTTTDSDVVVNNEIYIYNDELGDNSPSIAVSDNNTVQIKVLNSASPYQWKCEMDNNILELKSKTTAFAYNADYDYNQDMPGGASCEIQSLVPTSAGEVNIKFVCSNILDEADIIQTKTVKLIIDENLKVEVVDDKG